MRGCGIVLGRQEAVVHEGPGVLNLNEFRNRYSLCTCTYVCMYMYVQYITLVHFAFSAFHKEGRFAVVVVHA